MKALLRLAILLFVQHISIHCVWGQGCLRALKRDSDPSDPPFNDENRNSALPANNDVQALITTYQFHCCAKITTWETFVQPGGGMHKNGAYDITFQVWRPSPSNANCYSLVGQNAFTRVSFDGSVSLSPTPAQSAITVQSGDVVGYYTDSTRNPNEGIQLDRSDEYNQNEIWYLQLGGSQPMFMGPASNLLSVGVNGYLTSSTSAAPALKVIASTFDTCPHSMVTSFSCLPMMQSSTQLLFLTTSIGPSSVMATAVSTSIVAPVFSSDINIGLSTFNPSSDLVPTPVIYFSSTDYSMAPSISSPSGIVEMSTTGSLSGNVGPSFRVTSSSLVIAQTTSGDVFLMLSSTAPSSLQSSILSLSSPSGMVEVSTPAFFSVSEGLSFNEESFPSIISPTTSSDVNLIMATSNLESSITSLSAQSEMVEVSTPASLSVSEGPSFNEESFPSILSPTTSSDVNLIMATSNLERSITSLFAQSEMVEVSTPASLSSRVRSSFYEAPSSVIAQTTFSDVLFSVNTEADHDVTSTVDMTGLIIQPSSSQNQVLLQTTATIPSANNDVSSTVVFSPTSTIVATESSPSNQSSSPIIAAIVVIVMLLIILAILSVLIILVIVRRKNSVKKVKLDNETLDLSNPSYMSSSATFLLKEQKPHETKRDGSSSVIPDDTYESLDYKLLPDTTPEPLDYSLPLPGQPSTSSKPSLNAMFASGNKDELQEETLYHDVGPAAGIKSTSGNSSEPPLIPTRYSKDARSSSNLSMVPPLPAKTTMSEGANNFYYALEEPSEGFYEDPLPPNQKLGAEESIRERQLFEVIGTYVPTEEERDHCDSIKHPTKPVSNGTKGSFYVEESIYWEPATTTSGLYSQLATKKYREITREQIRLKSTLGSGQFGEVYKATWNIDEHELELAVKTLKAGASEEDNVKFLQEAAIMGQFSHTNVIKMYGVVTLGEPVLICLEFLENGDLREYLQHLNLVGSKYEDFIGTQLMFLRFAKDIASGMNYLSTKSFVHRDLAARNVLVNKFLTCKIADFGMARDLMDDTYYKSSGGKIPVKWTAPEALLYQKYSTDSDVWSYGMVLFEIWSVARKPFSMLSNAQVLQLIQQGFCQAPPPGCPRAIYQLMVDCWNPQHQSRPSFSTINLKYLSQSPEKLLHWAAEDNDLSPSVGVCGAPLLEAEELYPDLQKKYMKL